MASETPSAPPPGPQPDTGPDRRLRALSHVEDEIAVAAPHTDLVLDALRGNGEVLTDEHDVYDRLGLVRVRVHRTEDVAARFAGRVISGGDAGQRRRDLHATTNLDVVLSGLRMYFADRWAGWTPTIGKNRELIGGEGTPAVKWLSGDTPPQAVARLDASGPETGGDGVRIGLVDTKIAPDLPASSSLRSRLTMTAADVLERPDDDIWPFRLGHGTFLAGLIHQHAPQADIVPRPVLLTDDATTTSWDVAVALLDLVRPRDGGAPRADVVVLALGCMTRDGQPPLVLKTAVDMVRDDVVIIAAGGNYGDMSMADIRTTGLSRQTPMWPAALDGVTAVGSHDGSGTRSGFSPQVPWIDLLGPGEALTSEYLQGKVRIPGESAATATIESFAEGYARWGGSSMSAAVAAGRLATLRHPGEPLRQTLARLRRDADVPVVVRADLRSCGCPDEDA